MGITTLYYFLAFLLFIVCIAGLQKWFVLPQQKKDKIGLFVLCIFIIALLIFVLLIILKPTYLKADTVDFIGLFFIFLIIVFTAFIVKWYNDKYHKKLNIGSIVIAASLLFFAAAYFILKQQGADEKTAIIKDVQLNTVVTNITFDTHKPYFKDMILANGQHLPMPEAMNTMLQVGDSIYKSKGENFYTVVSAATKTITTIEVKVHERVLGKPQ